MAPARWGERGIACAGPPWPHLTVLWDRVDATRIGLIGGFEVLAWHMRYGPMPLTDAGLPTCSFCRWAARCPHSSRDFQ
eukprot:7389471-Prymnesium_polylepis.1